MAIERFLCHFSELPFGHARGFDPDNKGEDTVIVLHDMNGIRAFLNLCPHEDRPLGLKKDRFLTPDGSALMCFAHGARFDRQTGLCFSGACIGQSLRRIGCRVNAQGEVLLGDEAPGSIGT